MGCLKDLYSGALLVLPNLLVLPPLLALLPLLLPSLVLSLRRFHCDVDVDVVRSLGVNGDVDNQLSTRSEGNIGLEESMFGDQMLVWGEKLAGFPVIPEQDGIRQVARLMDAPGLGTLFATRWWTY